MVINVNELCASRGTPPLAVTRAPSSSLTPSLPSRSAVLSVTTVEDMVGGALPPDLWLIHAIPVGEWCVSGVVAGVSDVFPALRS